MVGAARIAPTHSKVDQDTIAATFLALTLAADRFGDRPLTVTGTDAFKAQVAQSPP
ncbi:MAG: hypothetical protein QOI16_4312 [Pseudonocardiales bacterium]|jgi:hypothetical protein|nr:hypothetical protein [Pseudonocardiales bacterium]